MKLDCATITNDQHTFTVVIVPKVILDDQQRAEQTIQFLQARHFQTPTVLMARDQHGVPNSFYGRGDIAVVLAHIAPATIPWQELVIH
jgi:hypothetical protein